MLPVYELCFYERLGMDFILNCICKTVFRQRKQGLPIKCFCVWEPHIMHGSYLFLTKRNPSRIFVDSVKLESSLLP